MLRLNSDQPVFLSLRNPAPFRVAALPVALVVLLMGGCDSSKSSQAIQTPSDTEAVRSTLTQNRPALRSATTTSPSTSLSVDQNAELGVQPTDRQAKLGEPAPDFTLKDLAGLEVRLKDLLGKTVVLEWFNPECPFVRLSHTKGSLKDAAKRHEKAGIEWLGINSAALGKQGQAAEVNRQAKREFGMEHPLLMDETGTVGRIYAAERTPHLYIIDPNGILVYRGAVDNSPDGEGASPEGGKLVAYVDQALAELASGKPVSVPETKAYGCSVKYAD